MNFRFSNINLKEFLKCLTIGIIVVIGTFPDNDWSFSVGIDSPLKWVYNYLFNSGLIIGKQIIFPHGPLAFLMYPLQENIILSTVVTSMLKILLVFNIIKLIEYKGTLKWALSFILAYFISVIAEFNHLIIINIICLYLNYYNTEKIIYKLLAFIITAIAFYIKSYIAIVSGTMLFSFLIIYFIKYRLFLKTGIDIITNIGFIFLVWLCMYGSYSGFYEYIKGMYFLAQDNSTATSYYPYNNWWILTCFLLIILYLLFFNNTKKSNFYGSLIILSLFAAWKHGMAREDIVHISGFFEFVIITQVIFILFDSNNFFKNIIFSSIAIILLMSNMKNCIDYHPTSYQIFRFNNFFDFITDFSSLKSKAKNEINYLTSENRLPQSIIDSIKSGTVDVYPWDYSFIPINNLHWQPRVVINSYASYTSWLDIKNAEHFNSDKAPDYIIWLNHAQGLNNSYVNSIDDRYLLNDEPNTIIQIFRNYKIDYSNNNLIILKKRKNAINTTVNSIGKAHTCWGEWLNVPNESQGLLRAKLNFEKSILQHLKSFIYKDEQFWIYLKLSNGTIHKYKIVPKNAQDGIWINPYIIKMTNNFIDPVVTDIMFKCSNQSILNNKLNINWDEITFENEPGYILKFLNKTKLFQDSIYLNSINTFEKNKNNNWGTLPDEQIIRFDSHSGQNSHCLKPNMYSCTFIFPMDSLPFSNIRITTDCWMKSKKYNYSNNISLIISIENDLGSFLIKSIQIDEQMIDEKQWNNIFNYIDYKHDKSKCNLKVYVWNLSDKDVFIDDFKVTIFKTKE